MCLPIVVFVLSVTQDFHPELLFFGLKPLWWFRGVDQLAVSSSFGLSHSICFITLTYEVVSLLASIVCVANPTLSFTDSLRFGAFSHPGPTFFSLYSSLFLFPCPFLPFFLKALVIYGKGSSTELSYSFPLVNVKVSLINSHKPDGVMHTSRDTETGRSLVSTVDSSWMTKHGL